VSEDIPEPDRLENVPHPRNTAQLFGQEPAEAAFLDAYRQHRLHHAWLITGPKGIGKATLAWHIARFLIAQDVATNSLSPTMPETLHVSPNEPVFKRVASLGEPGIYLCRRAWDEKKKALKTQIGVEVVRKLKGFFELTATDGGWRIAIVDSMDEMNAQGENALLKILEEPPRKTLLLLVAHQPSRLLPTIRSRCRELRCQTMQSAILHQVMRQAGLNVDGDLAELGALSGGSASAATELLASDGLTLYHEIIGLFSTCPRMNRGHIHALADKCGGVAGRGRYDMTVRLILQAVSRLGLAGARGLDITVGAEAEVAARLSNSARQAQIWAVLAQELTERTTHARAVNLDPSQVILDTFLKIDKAASRAIKLSA